jgi:hypothetical protein
MKPHNSQPLTSCAGASSRWVTVKHGQAYGTSVIIHSSLQPKRYERQPTVSKWLPPVPTAGSVKSYAIISRSSRPAPQPPARATSSQE